MNVQFNTNIWDIIRQNDLIKLKYLLLNGVHVDERDDLGNTSLHIAATLGYYDIIKVLLKFGPNVDLKDKESGWTALHRCFYYHHFECALLLIENGASFLNNKQNNLILDNENNSPLDLLTIVLQKKYKNILNNTTIRGDLFTLGKSDFQLGYPCSDSIQRTPKKVNFTSGCPTQSCNNDICSGHENIINFSSNRFHNIGISTDGKCYSWGFGKGGRLGTGDQYNLVDPREIYIGIKVVSAAAGEDHSLVLTEDGQVFSWGSNGFGQLGYELQNPAILSENCRFTPKKIIFLSSNDKIKSKIKDSVKIVKICASKYHSGAICDRGQVYTWGCNRKGQLGRKEGFGTDHAFPVPRLVEAFISNQKSLSKATLINRELVATDIFCANDYTCVIVLKRWNDMSMLHSEGPDSETSSIFQFGFGFHIPYKVNFPGQKRKINIKSISCSKNHTLALTDTGRVFIFNSFSNYNSGKHLSLAQEIIIHSHSYNNNNNKIIGLSTSETYSAFVTKLGDLYVTGNTNNNKIKNELYTTYIDSAKNVRKVIVTDNHIAFLVNKPVPSVDVPNIDNSSEAFSQEGRSYQIKMNETNETHTKITPDETNNKNKIKSLWEITQKHFYSCINNSNIFKILEYAHFLNASLLIKYCNRYKIMNLDSLLLLHYHHSSNDFFNQKSLPTVHDELKKEDSNTTKMNENIAKPSPSKFKEGTFSKLVVYTRGQDRNKSGCQNSNSKSNCISNDKSIGRSVGNKKPYSNVQKPEISKFDEFRNGSNNVIHKGTEKNDTFQINTSENVTSSQSCFNKDTSKWTHVYQHKSVFNETCNVFASKSKKYDTKIYYKNDSSHNKDKSSNLAVEMDIRKKTDNSIPLDYFLKITKKNKKKMNLENNCISAANKVAEKKEFVWKCAVNGKNNNDVFINRIQDEQLKEAKRFELNKSSWGRNEKKSINLLSLIEEEEIRKQVQLIDQMCQKRNLKSTDYKTY